jgi:myosin I
MEKKPVWKDVMRQEGVDDMTLLTKINNDSIAQNLKERFDADIIYV